MKEMRPHLALVFLFLGVVGVVGVRPSGDGPRRLRAERASLLTRVNTSRVDASSSVVVSTPPDPETIAAMKKVYTMQFVGIAANGKEPRSPRSPEANRCLFTIGEDDIPGGVGLSMKQCPSAVTTDAKGKPTGKTQDPIPAELFELYPDGRIRNVATGKCIRRTACNSDLVKIYDLGACDAENVAKFQIESSRSNRIDITQQEGFPLNGVRGSCESCGPFLLQQVCHGACGDDPAPTGWTKQRSAYLDNFDFTGKTGPISYRQMAPNMTPLCNSFIRSDDNVASWWYFNKYDDPRTKG